MKIINASVFHKDGYFFPGEIEIEGTKFARVRKTGGAPDCDGQNGGGKAVNDRDKGIVNVGHIDVENDSYNNVGNDGHNNVVLDACGCYAIPGLIDIHVHGCAGYDFSDADVGGLRKMLRYQAVSGVTAVCPTLMTLPEEDLALACGRIKEVLASPDGESAGSVGIYLEGPFLSPDKAGAQNPAYMTPPSVGMFERLQKASGGNVRVLAVAPELAGAPELIEALAKKVVVTVAHTNTTYDVAAAAFGRGAKLVTHLYNGMSGFTHREPNVVGAVFDTPGVTAELVCDGVHLHPAAVRIALRILGDRRLAFISDSMMATGLGDGIYELGGLAVKVEGKEARLVIGGNIASSVSNLMDCLRVAVNTVGVPLESAVRCASVNPAEALGASGERGDVAEGKLADLVLLDKNLNVKEVFLRGRRLTNISRET